jgi:histidyl-tRNA synthetase
MSKIQPRIYQGTRDFLPEEMLKRQRIIKTVRTAFERYGFLPVETPAIEYLDILTGKYGDEGDKLIYPLAYKDGKTLALRYDQTVPLSRLMAMYHGQLTMPFKRYQIQPVWRADRPQKGRYREFYQLDADIVGEDGFLADAEIIALTHEIFSSLGFEKFLIRVNHRMALRALTLDAGLEKNQEVDVCRAIDKLDKIGRDGVAKELANSGIDDSAANTLFSRLLDTEYSLDQLEQLTQEFAEKFDDVSGVDNLAELYRTVIALGVPEHQVKIDLTLARGLDYYTGPIFETVLTEPEGFGSVSGGGRYDELIGTYSNVDISATGVSFGLDRIYGAMEELNLHQEKQTTTSVLVVNFGGEEEIHAMRLAGRLRQRGVNTEVYFKPAKMKKQFGYADKNGIEYVAIFGSDEIKSDSISLKNMKTGDQETLPFEQALQKLQNIFDD